MNLFVLLSEQQTKPISFILFKTSHKK